MAQIKTQHVDVNGQVVHTEYYADGEYEQVLADEAKARLEAKNKVIEAQRADRYSKEADPYFVQATYKPEKAEALVAEGLRIKAKIKAELPYEIEAQETTA
jgi:hypothetical protein